MYGHDIIYDVVVVDGNNKDVQAINFNILSELSSAGDRPEQLLLSYSILNSLIKSRWNEYPRKSAVEFKCV